MFLLPKGKPLAENFPIAKLQLPEAFDKLKNAKITGCATFDFPSADCSVIYEDGKLVSALLHRNNTVLKDVDALHALVDMMLMSNTGNFSAYSFSKNVNQAVLALLQGNKIIDKQDMQQIDFKALLERIKNEQMTAALKIYTEQRFGMILYKDGATAGFFDDSSREIITSSAEVQRIAALPGASVDLFVLKETERPTQDLTERVNIRSLWEGSNSDVFSSLTPKNAPLPPATPIEQLAPQPKENSADIESAIIAIANSIVGKLGKTLVEKELTNIGGIKALKITTKLSEFLNAVEKSSKLLASNNKIMEMRDAISSEAAKL